MLNQNVKNGAVAQFEANAGYIRQNIGYHTAMDHYNIDFGNAMFEWAKDMSSNDKDIVFVLNPEPLIAAGVEPKNVDGWTYAQVPVMQGGKETQVYKFLKPFDLN
jgi:trans-aconitate methyltransferase